MINCFFFFYFTLCQTQLFIDFKITNIMVIVLLCLSIIKLINIKLMFVNYFFIVFIIYLTLTMFAIVGFSIENGYRVLFYSFLSLLPLIEKYKVCNIEFILRYTGKYYTLLGCIILIDILWFVSFGEPMIWEVEFYITPRFYGPFYDPNFMGVIFAVIYLATYSRADRTSKFVYIGCVLASGSWSSILLLVLTVFIFTNRVVVKKIYLIPVLLFFSYLLIAYCISLYPKAALNFFP